MGLTATSASAATAPPSVDCVAIADASAVAAPNEFAAILRCYVPGEASEHTGRFTRLNMALRGGPPYRDVEGARSWWAW